MIRVFARQKHKIQRGFSAESYFSVRGAVEGVQWLEAHDVKPVYQLFDTNTHLGFKRHIFDKSIDKVRPRIMNIQLGKHDAHVSNQDPWSYLQLIANMNMVKANIPESLIGLISRRPKLAAHGDDGDHGRG